MRTCSRCKQGLGPNNWILCSACMEEVGSQLSHESPEMQEETFRVAAILFEEITGEKVEPGAKESILGELKSKLN